MDINRLTSLMDWMKDTPLTEFEWSDGTQTIRLVKSGSGLVQAPIMRRATPKPASEAPLDSAEADVVKAPFMGIVHLTSEPDGPAHVEIGQRVETGQVLCSIEAMKVFNTVHAEQAGVIKDIFVRSGEQVNLDQPLFRISNS